MKESYIKGKIAYITNKIVGNATIDRLEKERKISVVCNRVRQEFLAASGQFEQHLTKAVYQIMREELK